MAGGGIVLHLKVDDRAVMAALRAQRRGINADIKQVTLDAAEAEILPVVKAFAVPTRMKKTWVARSNSRGAWITTVARGKGRNIIALLNFGGTVRATIRPTGATGGKGAKALYFGGRFAANVRSPRRYKGKHFVEKAIDINLHRYSAHVERQLTRLLQDRVAATRMAA